MLGTQGFLATSTRRIVVIAALATLLLTTPTIFLASTLYSYGDNLPNIDGVPADKHLNLGSTEESWRDAFTLQPNEHIFRKPRTIRATWNVTMGERAPDGVKKMVYLINGLRIKLN